jgi:hypothetical protein
MPEFPRLLGFMSVLEPVFTKPAFIACISLSTGWTLRLRQTHPRRHLSLRRSEAGKPRSSLPLFLPCNRLATKRTVRLLDKMPCQSSFSRSENSAYCHRRYNPEKNGSKADGGRIGRDAVRSTTSDTILCWALQHVALCLVFHSPYRLPASTLQ